MTGRVSPGLTLVEILLGVAVGGLILGALAIFATRGFGVPREQAEQARIVEDARVQIERMSDAIRDAQGIDVNNDGATTLPEEMWLVAGSDFDIEFLTNYDTDSGLERVHYYLDGADLKLGVRDPYDAGTPEQVTIVARSVRNVSEPTPLFEYLPAEGEATIATPITAVDTVGRVRIRLVVDVSETQDPTAARVETVVRPRAATGLAGVVSPTPTPSSSPTPTPDPPTVDVDANGQDGPVQSSPGSTVNLSWTSTNATSCTASGDWGGSKAVNGSETSPILLGNVSSLRFDGVDERVRVDSPGLPAGNGAVYTYSLWVNLTSNDDETLLMASDGGGGDEIRIAVERYPVNNNPGSLIVRVNGEAYPMRTVDGVIGVNQWKHIAFVQGANGRKLYVGGTEIVDSGDGSNLNFGTCPLYLGARVTTACNSGFIAPLNGRLDDVRVYSRELTPTEVTQLSQGLAGPADSVRLYYKLDDATGTAVNDSSSNNRDGVMENMEPGDWDSSNKAPLKSVYGFDLQCTGPGGTATDRVVVDTNLTLAAVDIKADGSDGPISLSNGQSATLSWTSSEANSCTASGDWSGSKAVSGSESTPLLGNLFALRMDGVNEYVQVPDNNAWTFSGDFTIGAWVNYSAIDTAGEWWRTALVSHTEGAGSTNKWIFGYDGDANKQLVFHINRPGVCTAEIRSNAWTATTNTWYHVAVVRSGSTYTFYRDGVAIGSSTNACGMSNAVAPLRIGWGEGATTKALNGRMDDVRVWSRAVSGQELSDYLAGRDSVTGSLQAHWRFDNGTGTSATDSSGNNRTGTLTNMEATDWDGLNRAPLASIYRYWLACSGAGGSGEDVVTIGVNAPPFSGGPPPPPPSRRPMVEYDDQGNLFLADEINQLFRRTPYDTGSWVSDGSPPAGAGLVLGNAFEGWEVDFMIMAMEDGKLYRRQAGSSTWSYLGLSPTSGQVRALAFDEGGFSQESHQCGHYVMVATDQSKLFRREYDLGFSDCTGGSGYWENIGNVPAGAGLPVGLAYDDVATPHTIIGMEDGRIFQGDIAGEPWTHVQTAPSNEGQIVSLAYHSQSDYLIAAMGSGKIFRSVFSTPFSSWQQIGSMP